MKLEVENVIEGSARDFLGWGMSPEGEAVMQLIVGSRRVRVTMSVAEAKEAGMCAIHAAFMIQMTLAQQHGAASSLIGPDGIPLGSKLSS